MLGGDHHVECCEFGGRVFYTRGCFFLDFPVEGLGVTVGFGSGFLGPRYPGSGHYRPFRRLRIRMWRGNRIRFWSASPFDETPSPNDVFPSLAQVQLLGGGPGSLSFRSDM